MKVIIYIILNYTMFKLYGNMRVKKMLPFYEVTL